MESLVGVAMSLLATVALTLAWGGLLGLTATLSVLACVIAVLIVLVIRVRRESRDQQGEMDRWRASRDA